MRVILFKNLVDRVWKYSVISRTTSQDEVKEMIEKDIKTHSFHGVFDNHIQAMEVSKHLDDISSDVSHLQLNPETQHLYD